MSKNKKMSLGDFLGNSNYAPKARLPTGPSVGEDDGSRDGYGRGGRDGPRGEGGSHWRGSGRWADDEEDEEAQSAAMTDDNWRRGPPEGSGFGDRGPGGRGFGDRERGGYGDRFGDRDRGFRGEGFGDRDRYGDRGGDRYSDRGGFGGDRYGDRGGFGGDRYGDRGGFGGDRYGDRDRYGSDRGFGDRGDRGFGSYGGRGPGVRDSFNEAPSERPAHLKLQLKKRETPIPAEPTKPSTEKQEPAKAESVTKPSSPRRKVDPFGGARAVLTKDALEYQNPPSAEKQPEKLDKWARLEAEMLAGESRSGLRTIGGGPRSDRRDSGERSNISRREDPGRGRLSDSPARREGDRVRPSGSRSPPRGGSRSRSPGARQAPVTKVEEKLEELTVQDEDTSKSKPQEEVQKRSTESPEELQKKRDDLISKILESDLRGSALKDWVKEQATAANVELKGGQILAALLRAKAVKSKNDDLKWVTQGQYGALLGDYLYEVAPKEAMEALFEAQRYYIEVGHPKGLLEKLFIQLHQCDVIEDQGFIEWKDDLSDKVPGKTTAIIDVTKFLQWLEEEEEEEEEEEDEEE